MWKAYIWDLDGTLLDSYGSIVSSLVSVARDVKRIISHSFSMALPFGRPGKIFFAQAAPGTAAMHHWYLFSIASQ